MSLLGMLSQATYRQRSNNPRRTGCSAALRSTTTKAPQLYLLGTCLGASTPLG